MVGDVEIKISIPLQHQILAAEVRRIAHPGIEMEAPVEAEALEEAEVRSRVVTPVDIRMVWKLSTPLLLGKSIPRHGPQDGLRVATTEEVEGMMMEADPTMTFKGVQEADSDGAVRPRPLRVSHGSLSAAREWTAKRLQGLQRL